ncbi:MAG: hypothetical protein ACYDGM_13615 [Vulcanimicrobiaceae bacterium]
MKRLAIAGAVLLAFALADCGQHAQSITPSGPATYGFGNATFIIKVPQATTTSLSKPKYISPATQSVTITVNGVSTPTTVNLTPSSPNCTTPSGGTLTCTASVSAPIGSDTFTLTTFDKTNGAGNQLSTGTVTATIASGTTNNVAVTLNGVVASVSVSLANTAPPVGASATIPLTVTAKDADGDTIVGPGNYTPTITLSSSDSTNAALSVTTVSAPGATVTVTYSGAAITSATITATITGTSTTATAKLTPTAGVQSGSGAVGVVTIGGNTYAEVPSAGGLLQIQIAAGGTIASGHKPPFTAAPTPSPSPLVLTPAPDACAISSGSSIFAYCITYDASVAPIPGPQGIINVVDLTSGTPTFVRSITTDATTSGVSFSGATCYICGVAWDPKDNAIIISTANGYEFYDPGTASGKQVIATIPAPISENFGYNPVTDQIWSPTYTEFDLVDVASRTWYTLTGSSLTTAGDGGAVDSSTNIGMAIDEGPIYDSYVPLDSANAILSTPPPAAGSAGTFTDAKASQATTTSDAGCRTTAFAIDSTTHVAFLSGEFSNPDCVGAIQLPSASLTTPFTPTTWMFIPAMPNTPDGNTFDSAGDPHVAITFNLPGDPDLLGAVFNYTRSYVAVVDITKLFAAPSSSTDPHQVSPTYDPIANGVLFYIPTGYSGGPATARVHRQRG